MIKCYDNVLKEDVRKIVYSFLQAPTWNFGWKSFPKNDTYSFWHKHFAGHEVPDHEAPSAPYNCADELKKNAQLLYYFWQYLERTILKGHTLIRCYANGQPYGTEGTLHTDSVSDSSFTSIYYPHEKWYPNWGGETVFFNNEKTDIMSAIYPKPNRLVTFNGTIPHVARGVSRTCPMLRITLMFKTELKNGKVPAIPDGQPSPRSEAQRKEPANTSATDFYIAKAME